MPSARARDFQLTQHGRMRLYSTEELMDMPPPRWQVGGLIPEKSFSVLYGPSGVGKSFEAIDISMSVGSGLHWADRPTQKGYVVYVSAEGTAGLGQRVKAWMLDTGLDHRDVDIAWLPEAISLHSDEDLDALFARFDELERDPTLMVVDTLARCFEGDENSTEDMSRFVKGVDRIRMKFDCTVLAIHHTGASGDKERGNTALRAASDAMIRMIPGVLGGKPSGSHLRDPEGFTLVVSKQKDAVAGPMGIGRLRSVKGTTSAVADLEWLDENEGL